MVAETTNENALVEFFLDQPAKKATMVYRPYGLRTLKVKVSTKKSWPKMIIRPQGFRQDEAAKGVFYAQADNSEAFLISWGGGHEQGLCAKSKDFGFIEKCQPFKESRIPFTNAEPEPSFLFFNVRHIGGTLPENGKPTITLEAYELVDKMPQGEPVATLPITLERPPDRPDSGKIMRFQQAGATWRLSAGDHLPDYDSRWWPAKKVTYEKQDSELPLTIHQEQNRFSLRWQEQETPLATITDYTGTIAQTEQIDLLFELFAFDKWSVALRVWFFWLDSRIDNTDDDREIGIFGRNEIPDAERFDFIIRRTDGLVLLACTDLHWREQWGLTIYQKPPQATLGMGRQTRVALIEEKLAWWKKINALVAKKLNQREQPYHNPLHHIRAIIRREAKLRLRGKGTGAHIPALHNVIRPTKREYLYISSDVRQG